MIKIFTLLLFIVISLNARENPFFPSSGEADITYTSNQDTKAAPLKRATMTLPSSARIIESVIIKYKDLDGSIHEKSVELGNAIDWHLPVFISQNYGGTNSEPKKIKKETYAKVAGLKFISLYESKKTLKVVTKDKMIRNFLLTKPHRIVCDFKRDIDIRSYEKYVKNSIVKRIRLGNHKGYYRVVIELDGYYRYKVKDSKQGYVFNFL